MSAHDTFWLARYAYNKLSPVVTALQAHNPETEIRLGIDLNFSGKYPGVQANVFVSQGGTTDILLWRTKHDKDYIDRMAADLPKALSDWQEKHGFPMGVPLEVTA